MMSINPMRLIEFVTRFGWKGRTIAHLIVAIFSGIICATLQFFSEMELSKEEIAMIGGFIGSFVNSWLPSPATVKLTKEEALSDAAKNS